MLDKYYTPEIEEFYEGFEFEQKGKTTEFKVKIGENGGPVKCSESIITTGWITNKYDAFAFTETKYISEIDKVAAINTLDYYLNSGEIRVKYLDEQDILDLGFTRVYNHFFTIKSKRYVGSYNLCFISSTIKGLLPAVVIDYVYNDFKDQLFRGTCKNKSELKQIIKQIINE